MKYYKDDGEGKPTYYSLPVPGSQEAIRRLSYWYEIVVVSSVSGDSCGLVNKFLDYYFPGIPDFVFTSNKALVSGDVMIDDSMKNLYSTQCPIKILFHDKPQVEQLYIQFSRWSDVADYLIEIAKAYEKAISAKQ